MTAILEALAADLKKHSAAEIHIDHATRLLYSTDASSYRIMPLAVVAPRHYDDVLATAEACIQLGLPMLPRGGGSSLSGQTVGEAVVIDFSKYLDAVVKVDAQRRRVLVQAGAVLDRLNRHLKPYGLMVGPDPASSARATIGGIVGNNATGSHSLLYGMMVDHVVSLRAVLADGKESRLGPVVWPEVKRQNQGQDFVSALGAQIASLIETHAPAIDDQFPKYWRRAGGYNLDRIRHQLQGDSFNLAPLVVGSEGTLGIILEAELDLVPIPRHKALAVLHYMSLDAALREVPALLELQPAAIELIDDVLIGLTRGSPVWSQRLTCIEGDPAAVLVVEFAGDDEKYLADRYHAIDRYHAQTTACHAVVKVADGPGMANVWEVRKAGLNLLASMRGDAKPVPCIEDAAVPPEQLADYIADLTAVMDGRGVASAMYAHASTGCIHVRPILNLKTKAGVTEMVELTRAAAALSKKYGGVLSSEHGDGLLRSFLNPEVFGPDVYDLFRQVKTLFDPDNLFNPGKIVDPLPPDENLRYGPGYQPIDLTDTFFDWSVDGSYAQAVEMCNGSGVCRKLDVGAMCPSFQALRDERHSTRGRANLLRAALNGELPDGLADPALAEALDLCLACKACKSECPSSVDMAKLKAEALAQKYRIESPPLSARVFANIDRISALAAPLAPLANFGLNFAPTRALASRLLDLHPARTMPKFQQKTFSRQLRIAMRKRSAWENARKSVDQAPSVALFPDTFTEFNEPGQGMAAVRVLEAAGGRVALTPRVCCGRPALSNGLVTDARERAAALVQALLPYHQAGIPVIGLEPSCALTIRDDYPDLLPGPDTEAVAQNIFLFDEFLAELLAADPRGLPLKSSRRRYLFHGHCYQKAISGLDASLAVLKAIPGAQAQAIDAGCCGMAGSFGYTKGHYDLSAAIANDRLLPALKAAPDAVVVANGISCRHQLRDLAGRQAIHLAEALAEVLDE
ncbi:MAG: FAD-binding protein [Caldilineales bacterium]|nr:FAD-binding protein [Caldilineales bacterium]